MSNEKLSIELLCNDGSPIGIIPPDIYGRGVGGAELAMMSLMETFAKRGHEVTVYNSPSSVGTYDGVRYMPVAAFDPRGNRDVLIIYRSPNQRAIPMIAKLRKVWWSCDQYTIGNFTELSKLVDFCITISPRHTDYHIKHWSIDPKKIGHFDLGVRLQDYERKFEPVKGRMIYCSVPDRGLNILHAAYPLIKRDVPHASLVITSDYRLWGLGNANNTRYRLDWAGMDGVTFYGKVSREKLCELQQTSEIHSYPCIYDELFCISVAECQVAGALPVTTLAGALKTTNEFGLTVNGSPTQPNFVRDYANRIIALLTTENEFLYSRRENMMRLARKRFDWNLIAKRWEFLFHNGRMDRVDDNLHK